MFAMVVVAEESDAGVRGENVPAITVRDVDLAGVVCSRRSWQDGVDQRSY